MVRCGYYEVVLTAYMERMSNVPIPLVPDLPGRIWMVLSTGSGAGGGRGIVANGSGGGWGAAVPMEVRAAH